MDAKTIVMREFLQRFREPDRKNVGVELEFPLLNLAREPVERHVALGLFTELLKQDFTQDAADTDGQPAFIINADGDVLSFDNSYNNFEFSMEKGESLLTMSERFYALYERVQQYFLPRGYSLCGLGTNPQQDLIAPSPVPYPIYQTLRTFLERYRGGAHHGWPEFPAYLSSVQTHLDTSAQTLPRALTLFAALDFVRALLFSNSPALSGAEGFSDAVCFRDYLWEQSGFGSLAANTGKVEGEFRTEDDVARLILSRSMFVRPNGEEFVLIPPVSVEKYFDGGADPDDIRGYLSFQNVEVTRRGTLEVRSDCAQPVSDAFAPPAFNLGILCALDEAEDALRDFFERNLPSYMQNAPDRNRILRDGVIYHYFLPAPEDEIRRLLCTLVSVAEKALLRRGKHEERLLAPLFSRAERITCPALEWKRLLASGVPFADAVARFASAAAKPC